MCTILVLNQVSPLAPVIVAANRDEFYARPTRPPEPLMGTRAMAGVDEVGGGTWMGVTADGFVVALTNQRQGRAADSARASRGSVVTNALALASVPALEASLQAIEPGTYNPFNLIYGSARELRCAYVRDDGVTMATVPPGVSVLPNDVLGSPAFPKAARARARAEEAIGRNPRAWPELAADLQKVLASHDHAELGELAAGDHPPLPSAMLVALDAMCVHTPVYGTRSFTIAALGLGEISHYMHGEGPPCTTAAVDRTTEVKAL